VAGLERSIAKRTAANPKYPGLLAAEIRRQRLIGELVVERKANHLTQVAVARAMNISQSVVAEIESAKADVRYSTLDRYVEAVSLRRKRLDVVPG
jgi:predicted transcriptional regulator